jgi:hypothetical protein
MAETYRIDIRLDFRGTAADAFRIADEAVHAINRRLPEVDSVDVAAIVDENFDDVI